VTFRLDNMHGPDLLVSRVQKAVVEPLGLDPTGQVKSGSILLKGPLLTVGVRNVVPGSKKIPARSQDQRKVYAYELEPRC
jgi:hypothetical protein